jgi:hypothetical protein
MSPHKLRSAQKFTLGPGGTGPTQELIKRHTQQAARPESKKQHDAVLIKPRRFSLDGSVCNHQLSVLVGSVACPPPNIHLVARDFCPGAKTRVKSSA